MEDQYNNESLASLEEPIDEQMISDAVAQAGADDQGREFGGPVGTNAPVLYASCAQKMAGNVLTLTDFLVGVLNAGDYFIVQEVLDPAAAATGSAHDLIARRFVTSYTYHSN